MNTQYQILGNRKIQHQSPSMTIFRYMAGASLSDHARRKIGDHLAVQRHLTALCLAQTGQHLHQLRLAVPLHAGQPQHLAGSCSEGEHFTYNQNGRGAIGESCVTAYVQRWMDSLMPNTSFQRTQVRALRGLGPLNSDR